MNIQLTKEEVEIAIAGLEHLFEAAEDVLKGPHNLRADDRLSFKRERDEAERLSTRLAKVIQ